jgi:hypothetical protein
MAVAIVASIVERHIIIAKAFLGRFWALIFPGNRVAGGVRSVQLDALVSESKYC